MSRRRKRNRRIDSDHPLSRLTCDIILLAHRTGDATREKLLDLGYTDGEIDRWGRQAVRRARRARPDLDHCTAAA